MVTWAHVRYSPPHSRTHTQSLVSGAEKRQFAAASCLQKHESVKKIEYFQFLSLYVAAVGGGDDFVGKVQQGKASSAVQRVDDVAAAWEISLRRAGQPPRAHPLALSTRSHSMSDWS